MTKILVGAGRDEMNDLLSFFALIGQQLTIQIFFIGWLIKTFAFGSSYVKGAELNVRDINGDTPVDLEYRQFQTTLFHH